MHAHEERIGAWSLRVERDAEGRVTGARCGPAKLGVDWAARRGVFTGADGGETWEAGWARGEYLDLPYGHEVPVNDELSLEAWVERRVFELRGGAFFEGGNDSAARALFDLARRERCFDRSTIHTGARAWAHNFAAIANDEELQELIALLDDRDGRQYLSYAREGAGKKRAAFFEHLAIPDDDDEARAMKKGHVLLKLKEKHPALELNRSLNNHAAPLIDAGDPAVPKLLAATRALVLARTPAEERFGGTAAVWGPAAGEFYWRVNECRVAFRRRTFRDAVHHARRALLLETMLHELSERDDAPSQFTSSAGSWSFSSMLSEVGLHAEASARFGELFDDEQRLERRAADPTSLQTAFVAGFYATWKAPLAERGDWARWFGLAREAVPKISWPLWAAWTADLWMTLDEVEEARSSLLVAQKLGHDVLNQTADPDWTGFLERHQLRKSRAWAALLRQA